MKKKSDWEDEQWQKDYAWELAEFGIVPEIPHERKSFFSIIKRFAPLIAIVICLAIIVPLGLTIKISPEVWVFIALGATFLLMLAIFLATGDLEIRSNPDGL